MVDDTWVVIQEGVGGHHHCYEETATGYWWWCEQCQCFGTGLCDHSKWPCMERANNMRHKWQLGLDS